MLCPVCEENPLTGRQQTCSTRCRSAKYRTEKQKERDASQEGAESCSSGEQAGSRSRSRPKPSSDLHKLERLVSTATERIIEAIQQNGPTATPQTRDVWRVDMREQLVSQAPKQATGYRLVLPAYRTGDTPKLSPARSRARDVEWYSLAPFEFPDDIRLCDGSWYRVVWVDAQGRRIRLQPGEPVPGLFYFVGPTQPPRDPLRHQDVLGAADPPPASDPTSGQPGAVQQAGAATSHTPPTFAPSGQTSRLEPLDEDIADELVNEIAARILAEEDEARKAAPVHAAVPEDKRPSLLAALPPQIVAEIPEGLKPVLGTMATLTVEASDQLVRFVQFPERMIQLLYEERLAQARASGGPLPPQPPTGLSHDERKTIHEILEGMVSDHFMTLCKLIHAFARKYGLEVLDCLPTPPLPLPEADRQRMQSAIANREKLAYLRYVHTWQESLLRSLPLPTEPKVNLSGKERNQLRRMMRDLRAVMLFEKQVRPPLSFLER